MRQHDPISQYMCSIIHAHRVSKYNQRVEDTPEEVVSYAHIPDGPPQQKMHKVTVQITLVLQRLHKEKKLEQFVRWGGRNQRLREQKGRKVKRKTGRI